MNESFISVHCSVGYYSCYSFVNEMIFFTIHSCAFYFHFSFLYSVFDSSNFFLFLAIFLQYFLVFVGVRTLQMDMSTPTSRPLLPYPEDLKSGKDIE